LQISLCLPRLRQFHTPIEGAGFVMRAAGVLPIPVGAVSAIVDRWDYHNIGGIFSQWDLTLGAAQPIDETAESPGRIPKVVNVQFCRSLDGSGGWYIGGLHSDRDTVPHSIAPY